MLPQATVALSLDWRQRLRAPIERSRPTFAPFSKWLVILPKRAAQINYQWSVPRGIRQLTEGGASDMPMTDDRFRKALPLHFPTVLRSGSVLTSQGHGSSAPKRLPKLSAKSRSGMTLRSRKTIQARNCRARISWSFIVRMAVARHSYLPTTCPRSARNGSPKWARTPP